MPENPSPSKIPLSANIVPGLLASGMYFGLVFVIEKFAYRWHTWFGLAWALLFTLCSLVFLALNYWTIRETTAAPGDGIKPVLTTFIRKFSGREVTAETMRVLELFGALPMFVLFLSSWTWMAYGFAQYTASAYEHPEQLSFWRMLHHYLWHTVDMVPLIDAWKTLHIEDPLKETQLWPGILVIAFRLITLYVLVAAVAKAFGLDKRKKKEE